MVQPEGITMSSFDPVPKIEPKVHPRQEPKVVVPSYIGEKGQVLNLLMYRGAGDDLRDYSGYGNHGTIYGSKWTDERSPSWALDFDGTDDYVEIPDDPILDITGELTVLLWVYLDASKPNKLINKDGGTSTSYKAQVYSNEKFYFYCDGGRPEPSKTISLNEWHHLAGRFDGGTITTFIDGEVDAQGSGFTLSTNDQPLLIGLFGGNYLNGKLAVIWIYNVARPDAEISRTFERTRSIFGV